MSDHLRGNDPGGWGHSLANLAEIMLPLLDAAEVRSVAEVGAYAGDLTRDLLDWAESAGARVIAVDPDPQPALIELSEQRDELDLVRAPSHEALPGLGAVDAIVLDGDHNHYTVREELRLIGERFPGAETPLLVLHDVCWPHARRDTYYDPERIPEGARRPMASGGRVFPGEPGLARGGLPYGWVAEREGGPGNGVLTAAEDFIAERPDLRMAVVPAFFGLGVIWPREAPWAAAAEAVLGHWDRNPVVARLEADRVLHLAREWSLMEEVARLRSLNERYAGLLEGLSGSQAFALGDRLASLRNPGREVGWREEARRLLAEREDNGTAPAGASESAGRGGEGPG